MSFNTLLEIRIENGSLHVVFGPLLIIILGLLFLVLFIRYLKGRNKARTKWKPVEIEASLANLGSIKLAPNNEIVRVAHQAWAELATRKASLPFDEENDVIVEIYDSWLELFREFRSLAKSIPAEEVRDNQDAQKAVKILVDALNKGIRPHLTQWQAKLRYWHSRERPNHPELSPQEFQRLFPQYKELVTDLRQVNNHLIEFAKSLSTIAHG